MGDPFKPQAMPTKRNKADDMFSQFLGQFMNASMGGSGAPNGRLPANPGEGISDWTKRNMASAGQAPAGGGPPATPGGFPDIGSWIADTFKMPEYGGDLSAGETGLQSAATGAGKSFMDSFFGKGGGNEKIQSALGAQLNPTKTDDPLAGLASPDIPTIESLYAKLDPVRQANMTRDLGNMQEQFGVSGLGNSTSLMESGARAQTESQQGLSAEIARMAPQLADVQSRDTLGRGQLRLGAGELDNAKQQLAQAAAGMMGSIPMNVATSGFNLGEGERQINQQGLDRMYQEFLRTQSLFPELLSYFSGTPPAPYAPSMFSQLTDVGAMALPFLDKG